MSQKLYWSGLRLFCCFIVVCLSSADWAQAQSNGGARNQFGSNYRNRPSVSPYMSMLDNGNGGNALNYYNIVRPQQRARQTARRLENEIEDVESNAKTSRLPGPSQTQTASITTGRMQPTGHSTSFSDVSGHFGNRGGGKAGGGVGASGGADNRFGRNGRKGR